MARNATFTLTPEQFVTAVRNHNAFVQAMEDEATVSFVAISRKDGSQSVRTGTVVEVSDNVETSNGFVKVMTENGPRCFNLYLILGMSE